jgi:hypothetical protein
MATKTFYATRDLKNPSYGTRMLKAGDPVELDGPKSRLYLALGAVTATKPKRISAVSAQTVADTLGETVSREAAPRKRTTKKRATAKK